MTSASPDVPRGEAKLAQVLIDQAREAWFGEKDEKAAELARSIVDRYWGVDGRIATSLVTDAYLVYLGAVRQKVKTADDVHLFFEQYDVLAARGLKAGQITLAIDCLRRKKFTSCLRRYYLAAYEAASQAVILVQQSRDSLVDANGSPMDDEQIIEDLRADLQDRIAVPDKAFFMGAIEDWVGFELKRREYDSFHIYGQAVHWLL